MLLCVQSEHTTELVRAGTGHRLGLGGSSVDGERTGAQSNDAGVEQEHGKDRMRTEMASCCKLGNHRELGYMPLICI